MTSDPVMTQATLTRAAELAHQGRVTADGIAAVYLVNGQRGVYRVVVGDGWNTCTCPATKPCKHIGAALLAHDERERIHDARSRRT